MDQRAATSWRASAVASAVMPQPSWMADPELPRRIDAAIVSAGRRPADVAPELNVSARTLERVIAGTRLPREWEVKRLAEVLEVPMWFLTEGFAGAARPSEDDRLAELARKIDGLDRKLDVMDSADRLTAIEEQLRELARARALEA